MAEGLDVTEIAALPMVALTGAQHHAISMGQAEAACHPVTASVAEQLPERTPFLILAEVSLCCLYEPGPHPTRFGVRRPAAGFQ